MLVFVILNKRTAFIRRDLKYRKSVDQQHWGENRSVFFIQTKTASKISHRTSTPICGTTPITPNYSVGYGSSDEGYNVEGYLYSDENTERGDMIDRGSGLVYPMGCVSNKASQRGEKLPGGTNRSNEAVCPTAICWRERL